MDLTSYSLSLRSTKSGANVSPSKESNAEPDQNGLATKFTPSSSSTIAHNRISRAIWHLISNRQTGSGPSWLCVVVRGQATSASNRSFIRRYFPLREPCHLDGLSSHRVSPRIQSRGPVWLRARHLNQALARGGWMPSTGTQPRGISDRRLSSGLLPDPTNASHF